MTIPEFPQFRDIDLECRDVNREQDLGIDGLRKAKMSYHPVNFIKKFKVKKR